MAQVWIKNSFHETDSKWYILSAYKTDFVKGKFKPNEDSLFKDGKETNFQSDQANYQF